jgi:hypothetical protein
MLLNCRSEHPESRKRTSCRISGHIGQTHLPTGGCGAFAGAAAFSANGVPGGAAIRRGARHELGSARNFSRQ